MPSPSLVVPTGDETNETVSCPETPHSRCRKFSLLGVGTRSQGRWAPVVTGTCTGGEGRTGGGRRCDATPRVVDSILVYCLLGGKDSGTRGRTRGSDDWCQVSKPGATFRVTSGQQKLGLVLNFGASDRSRPTGERTRSRGKELPWYTLIPPRASLTPLSTSPSITGVPLAM